MQGVLQVGAGSAVILPQPGEVALHGALLELGFMWHVVFTGSRGKVFPLRVKNKELLHKGVSKRHNIKEKREHQVA